MSSGEVVPPIPACHGVTQLGMSDDQVFDWAASTMSGEGVAVRSAQRFDPPVHVLAFDRLWCTGGKADEPTRGTATRRRCRRCVNLAREMWDEIGEHDAG